jgi:hypothetical protein
MMTGEELITMSVTDEKGRTVMIALTIETEMLINAHIQINHVMSGSAEEISGDIRPAGTITHERTLR